MHLRPCSRGGTTKFFNLNLNLDRMGNSEHNVHGFICGVLRHVRHLRLLSIENSIHCSVYFHMHLYFAKGVISKQYKKRKTITMMIFKNLTKRSLKFSV